jgi:polar amino acid transport system substrate-binding protein
MACAADTLRFAVGQSWAPPFVERRDGLPTGGLMLDLMAQIAANAGAQPRYVALPTKRVDAALALSEVDLHCYINPKWLHQPVADERWSVPMLRLDDVLAAAPGSATTPLLLDLQMQEPVGVVLGYSYPSLEPFFQGGQLRRDDAPTQERMLEKLARGRTRYAVMNSLVLESFNQRRPAAEQLVRLQTIETLNTYCLLAANPGLEPQRILAAVRKLVESGQLKAIMARYR